MTQKPYKHGLHWARHDLRVTDNEALYSLMQQCEHITVIYVFDPAWLKPNQFGHGHLGKHRHTFIDQGLVSFSEQLSALCIPFHMLRASPVDAISAIVKANSIDCFSYESHYGFYEQLHIAQLKEAFRDVNIIQGNSHYLLSHANLTFDISEMPDVFSPFRRKVEKNLALRKFIELDYTVCTSHQDVFNTAKYSAYVPTKLVSNNGYEGGEVHAKARIKDYFFTTNGIASYKETRNGLDGWDFSSRLSAYLAAGFVSPAYVNQQLQAYENKRIKNDSTYWLFFELLWREFFHLQSKKQGALFFDFGGIQDKTPNAKHNDALFKDWKNGKTDYPIVNAAMKQLAATGFMSNRARQLVASCFVHELQLDWRYGAAYFEEMLIDFDVASNYGNWQYLAGVGSDPRGHRQFNLDKQAQIYDPNGAFVNKWQ